MNTHIPSLAVSLVLTILLTSACEKPPSAAPVQPAPQVPTSAGTTAPDPSAAPPATSSAAPDAALSVAGLVFTVPVGWNQVPPANQMRLAEILVPGAGGDEAGACLITFSTAGGGVEANVARWAGQLKDPTGQPPPAPITTREVSALKVHTVEIKGAYQGMTDTAPRPDWMLRGAIIEIGEQPLFIKMTGPASSMEAAARGWTSLVDSVRKP